MIATYDGSQAKIYVNGMLKSTAAYVANMGPTLDSVLIGREQADPNHQYPFPFIGVIDDIQFYNRVLTPEEITSYSIPVPTGVAKADATSFSVEIVPNPATNFLDVQLAGAPLGGTVVQLFNTLGQSVYRSRFTGTTTRVSMLELAAGLYTLHLSSVANTLVQKVVKQ